VTVECAAEDSQLLLHSSKPWSSNCGVPVIRFLRRPQLSRHAHADGSMEVAVWSRAEIVEEGGRESLTVTGPYVYKMDAFLLVFASRRVVNINTTSTTSRICSTASFTIHPTRLRVSLPLSLPQEPGCLKHTQSSASSSPPS
jgi:hypothetical protein